MQTLNQTGIPDLQNVQIVPLSKTHLKQTIALAVSVFGSDEADPAQELQASIDSLAYQKYIAFYPETLSMHYYIALTVNQEVAGLIGLYTLQEDYQERTVWLGWYCVDPKFRNQKIGKQLLEFAIKQARSLCAERIRLYTSTHRDEAKAQLIYEHYNFKITSRVKKRGYDILYRSKKLNHSIGGLSV